MSRFPSLACLACLVNLLAGCGDSSPGAAADADVDGAPDGAADACVPPGAPPPVDCRGGACAAIEVPGDPIPATGFRGYADPSLRADPSGARVWMGYSFVRPAPYDDGMGGTVSTIQVETHLAHSDDAGASWVFDGTLWPNTPAPANTVTGYFNSEVVSLAPMAATSWFASRMAYLVETAPDPGIVVSSFMIRISHAGSPAALAGAPEQVIGLTSHLPAGYHAATDLNTLSGLSCGYWNDPSLFARGGVLYLTAECVGQGTIHVFAATAVDDVTRLVWSDRGALTTPTDAAALGDVELDQADLEEAADGSLLVTVTPSHLVPGQTLASHAGCRTLALDSLDPPVLHRDCGALVPRASVTASDLASTGSCGYDRHATGVGLVLARRGDGVHPGLLVKSGVP